MGALKRDAILGKRQLKSELVPVPEWEGEVRIRELMSWERDEFEASCFSIDEDGTRHNNWGNMRARLVLLCAIDDEGHQLFTKADLGDLSKESAAAMDRLYDVATRLSRLGAKDLETLKKNFTPAPNGATTSDSLANSG
jgi:hypothetical protein